MTKLVDISMFKDILLPTYMILMYIIWRFPKTEEPLIQVPACRAASPDGRMHWRPGRSWRNRSSSRDSDVGNKVNDTKNNGKPPFLMGKSTN